MSAATPPMPADAGQSGLSQGARIINTFIAPSKTFEDIRRNSSWWVAWLLISVFAIAAYITMDKKVGFDQIARSMMTSSSQFQQLPPEQQELIIARTATGTKWGGYASPVIVVIFALIMAVILMATFNFGMEAEVSFGRALSIVIYGWLPSVVKSVLIILTLIAGNPEGFKLQNPIGTNPAYFLDMAQTPKFLYAFLGNVDVIALWMVVLMGIGFAVNSKKKMSISTGITTVGVAFLVWTLITSAFAMLR